MKKLLIPITLLLFVGMVVSSSCKKDKEDPAPTKAQLLTRTTGWKVSALLIAGVDFFSVLDACSKDNVIKFTAATGGTSGSWTIDEGASKCDPDDDQTFDEGTWAFNTAQTEITVTPDGEDPYTVTIISLTTDTFKMEYHDDFFDATVTQTYTGQ